ncbi:MAG: hypothetical protein ACKOB3_05700 [Holophagaceae bacterium]
MRFTKFLKATTLAVFTTGLLSAQTFSGWDVAVKFTTGNVSGSLANRTGFNDSEPLNTFASGFEFTKNNWVLGINYRINPGRFNLISSIPHTSTAGTALVAGTPAGTYETRVRKPESFGYDFNALYRDNFYREGMYYQVGVRAQRWTVKETDTGSRETWSLAGTTYTLVSSAAIASAPTTSSMTLNPTFGIGQRFTDRYSGELNVTQSNVKFPNAGSKTGFITELSFGIKF